MVRQQLEVQPWGKHLEIYQDFSGGLNSVTNNEKLQDNEFTILKNVDLGERGSIRKRQGFKEFYPSAYLTIVNKNINGRIKKR